MIRAKVLSAALAAALVLGSAGMADAKAVKKTAKPLHGKIVSLNAKLKQFTVSTGTKNNLHTVKVTVTRTTAVKLNKKAGTFKSLKVGDNVLVAPSASHPTTVTDLGHATHHHINK